MKELDLYLSAKKAVFEYFGYIENWRVIPIDDAREFYWILILDDDGRNGSVRYAESIEQLSDDDYDYYENEIYTQRHLDRWVYEGEEFTMICVDTHTDGNKFLQIFDNSKRMVDNEKS